MKVRNRGDTSQRDCSLVVAAQRLVHRNRILADPLYVLARLLPTRGYDRLDFHPLVVKNASVEGLHCIFFVSNLDVEFTGTVFLILLRFFNQRRPYLSLDVIVLQTVKPLFLFV
jgi:hypothetical protein